MDKIEFIQETQKHISNVGLLLSKVVGELVNRATNHDMSKIGNATEHETFLEFTPKLKNSTYNSEEYKGFLTAMNVGLKSHYENNKHHPENHVGEGLSGMSLIDLLEMLCDWKAATMRHTDGDIVRSINQNQKRFGYSDELKQILFNTLEYL